MKAFESRFAEEELGEVRDVLLAGNLGFGENVSRLEDSFKDFSGKSHNVATNSASAAAFMIFAFLREKYGTCDVLMLTMSCFLTCKTMLKEEFVVLIK